jgi:hypothetical protein
VEIKHRPCFPRSLLNCDIFARVGFLSLGRYHVFSMKKLFDQWRNPTDIWRLPSSLGLDQVKYLCKDRIDFGLPRRFRGHGPANTWLKTSGGDSQVTDTRIVIACRYIDKTDIEHLHPRRHQLAASADRIIRTDAFKVWQRDIPDIGSVAALANLK